MAVKSYREMHQKKIIKRNKTCSVLFPRPGQRPTQKNMYCAEDYQINHCTKGGSKVPLKGGKRMDENKTAAVQQEKASPKLMVGS